MKDATSTLQGHTFFLSTCAYRKFDGLKMLHEGVAKTPDEQPSLLLLLFLLSLTLIQKTRREVGLGVKALGKLI